MSANNWTTCPKCKDRAATKQAQAAMDAAEAYGKVTIAQYEHLKLQIVEAAKFDRETMREDYELGVDQNGRFYVDYSCSCQTCDFEFSYRHEQQLPLKAEKAVQS